MSRFKGRPMDGLPGRLPAGEQVLWQGRPMAFALARRVLRTRLVVGYFALLVGWRLAVHMGAGENLAAALQGSLGGIGLGAAALALFYGFAFAIARSTTYTITDRRVVLTYGIALPKSLNLPYSALQAADVTLRAESGDIVLTPAGRRLSFLLLWPHVQAGPRGTTLPTLRCLADAKTAAEVLGRAVAPTPAMPMIDAALLAHAA
jgi:hypothetical protein